MSRIAGLDRPTPARLQGFAMEQVRLGLPPRDAHNPLSRMLFGLLTVVLGLCGAALVIFVVLPLLGIIVSAAVGGMILALAGIVMMVPFILVAGTVLAFMARAGTRKPNTFHARSHWR
jgi:hypothetical protein